MTTMITPMHPDDVNRIWLVPETNFSTRLLRQHLEKYPHLGWMVRENGDYIVGGYWKNRPTIGLVMESSPSSQRTNLVEQLLSSFKDTGSELAVISEREVTHGLRLYLDMGFTALEEVVCYERPDVRVPTIPHRLTMRPLQEADLPALVALEEETFPWLWWETGDSFRQSQRRPDTWVLLGYTGDELAGYLVLTVRGSWGHLNRIGVHPRQQGQGLGLELLAVAIEEMAHHGARSVGLNTQSDNTRSQRLYEGFGFVRTGETFRIYGRWLDGNRAPGSGLRGQGGDAP
jgi:[ribosomal protein S18]-alanine N-acetyltransferase